MFAEDPNRGCTVACQDFALKYRFYKVNGKDGWFPFGTECSSPEAKYKAFCLNGKCVVSFKIIQLDSILSWRELILILDLIKFFYNLWIHIVLSMCLMLVLSYLKSAT